MVTAIKDWQTETTVGCNVTTERLISFNQEACLFSLCFFVYLMQRSVVEVQWERKHRRNIYRLGHRGKVQSLPLVVFLYSLD